MRYVFITGTSRGLGEACLEVFKNDRIISISRSQINDSFNVYKSFNADFSNEVNLEKELTEVFNAVEPKADDEIFLINNAGTVSPVKPVSELTAEDYLSNYKVNVLAPGLLIKSFIEAFKSHTGSKRILTISSGAAVNAVEGWGAYCSSKAAVNMLSNVASLETARYEFPFEIAVFSPGVMDTDMQVEIRSSKENAFPDINRFKEYKFSGQLNSAFTVAKVVKEVITTETFSEKETYNVKDYL